MRIGAKIMLNTGLDAARDGLAVIAGSGWMMRLPPQDPYNGHPAGRARPGQRASGSWPQLVAVTFGTLHPGSAGMLPVQWESVEPGDESAALLLAGGLTLASAWGHATLTLAGLCQLQPDPDGGYAQARLEAVRQAARSFITSVAVTIARSADPGQEQPPGPAWSWLTGQRLSA